MPVILVEARNLHDRLRGIHPEIQQSTDFNLDSFERVLEDLGFAYGLEMDGIDYELGQDKPRVRIEVPANRYDLLCESGIAAAFSQFIAPQLVPRRKVRHSRPWQTTLTICASTHPIRPYAAGAIYRNVRFDEHTFAAFIDLQDKLHHNLARKRTLVAMGTHNLDAIEGPFTYECLPRSGGFHFVPLNQKETVDGNGMLEVLAQAHVKSYFSLIDKFDNFPVILDAKRRIILDQITVFLGELMNDPWTVEPVRCIYADDHPGVIDRNTKEVIREICTPTLMSESFTFDINYCRKVIGVQDITADSVVQLLIKMGLESTIDKSDPTKIQVICPINRRDVMGPCDIAEEVAIAYGFNNIKYSATPSVHFQDIQNIYDRARRTLCAAGWKECLTFGLISRADAYDNLGRKNQNLQVKDIYPLTYEAISVNDPKTREFEIVRPTLITGLLQTLSSNQASNLPIKIFETGEVVMADATADNRSRQSSRLAALIAQAHGSCIEHIHGLLDHVLSEFGFEAIYALTPTRHAHHKYRLREYSDGLFLPKRAVQIMVYNIDDKDSEVCIGVMGVVHPDTLKSFNIPWVCSIFEISLEPLLDWLDDLSRAAP